MAFLDNHNQRYFSRTNFKICSHIIFFILAISVSHGVTAGTMHYSAGGDTTLTINSTGPLGIYGVGNYGINGVGVGNYPVGVHGYASGGDGVSYGVLGDGYTNNEGGEAEGVHAAATAGPDALYVDGMESIVHGADPPTNPEQQVVGLDLISYNGVHNYGLYAVSNGGGTDTSTNWDAFFGGSKGIFVTGSCHPCFVSDEKFKKNIRPIEKGLSTIMSLKPKSYEMKTEEFKDQIQLPKGNQYGFTAQDVESILPELVHSVTAPRDRLTPEERKKGIKKKNLKFKGMEYTTLIPILVRAIQEQQAEIEALRKGK